MNSDTFGGTDTARVDHEVWEMEWVHEWVEDNGFTAHRNKKAISRRWEIQSNIIFTWRRKLSSCFNTGNGCLIFKLLPKYDKSPLTQTETGTKNYDPRFKN